MNEELRDSVLHGLGTIVLPTVLVVLFVSLLPGKIIPKGILSQKSVTIGFFKTAIASYAFGGVLFFIQYVNVNETSFHDLIEDPIGKVSFYLGLSLLLTVLLMPILAVIWISKAQEVNRRRGLQMVDASEGEP